MAYLSGDEELLASIAERMAAVVDSALRARLSGQYLGLLKERQSGRMGQDFHARVASLWEQTKQGMNQYTLWPGLGTVHGKFYDALDSAEAVLARLDRLVALQQDPAKRRRWAAEVHDIEFMLQKLANEAQMASTNAGLSRLDALAVSVANITSIQAIPRMTSWSAELKQKAPQIVPGGEFGITSLVNRPETWQQPEGLGDAAGGYAESLQNVLAAPGSATAAAQGGALLAEFKKDILRAKGLQARHALQGKKIAGVETVNLPRYNELSRNLGERDQRLMSVTANMRALAGNLKTMSIDQWDDPYAAVKDSLGIITDDHALAIMFYAPDVKNISSDLDALERDAALVDADLGGAGGLASGAAAGAFALGLGALALYAMSRKGR